MPTRPRSRRSAPQATADRGIGIGFLAVLTATVASHFVQVDQQSESSQVLETLGRIEADVAELKAQLAARH
jgi:hypothetical protein